VREFAVIRGILRRWGRWGTGPNLGYPAKAAFFGERTDRTPLYAPTEIPPDVHAAEIIICRLPYPDRSVLIQRYLWRLTFSRLGRTWGCSTASAYRKVVEAEGEFLAYFNACAPEMDGGIFGQNADPSDCNTDSPIAR
jgi:hypothetical protein